MMITPTGMASARGSLILPAGASSRLGDPHRSSWWSGTPVIGAGQPPTVEMTVAWTSQTEVHTPLEISHRPRDSHIPTAAPVFARDDTNPGARASRPHRGFQEGSRHGMTP